MTDTFGASVLRHVLQNVRQHHHSSTTSSSSSDNDSSAVFTETHGHLLASLGAEDLQLLQAASELVDRKAVKKVTALPSQRVFFRVESLNRYHHNQQQQQQQHTSHSQPFDASAMHGNGPNYYNCFDHYCSCSNFHVTTVKNPSAMCKHILAVLLADATSACVPMTIQDLDFAKMLCPQIPE